MKKTFSLILPLSLCYTSTLLAFSPVQSDISTGYTFDDNVTRAYGAANIEKDSIVYLDASAKYRIPLNDISYFSLRGSLDINQYIDFGKLSNNRLGLQGSYHIRPNPGYTAIRYFISLSLERRFYQSQQRDGNAYELKLGLSKRLTDTLTLRTGYAKQTIDSAESKGVFDASNSRIYLDGELRLSKNNSLYLTYNRFSGSIVSTSNLPPSILTVASGLIVRDDAFLDLTPPRYAYKLGVTTNTFHLGNNYAITSNSAIDLSVFYYDASAYISYTGLIYNLNYFYRF